MTATNNIEPKYPQKTTWLITPKTNLHVGNESAMSYGLIDKSVQRDALTSLPCINSSSLKGALNEFCCHKFNGKNEPIHKIFGSDKTGKTPVSQKGNTLFFDAQILFLPVQDDSVLYKLAYCDQVVDRFIAKAKLFGQPIENKDTFLEQIKTMTGRELVSENQNNFTKLCNDDQLPIIARNVLDNGESKNLWYEQVVPAETIFYTFIQSPTNTLEEAIKNQIVQIGASATIGYGYCQFTKIVMS